MFQNRWYDKAKSLDDADCHFDDAYWQLLPYQWWPSYHSFRWCILTAQTWILSQMLQQTKTWMMASSSLRNSLKRQNMCKMSWLLRWQDFCCFTWSSCCWKFVAGIHMEEGPGSQGRRIPQNALHEWIHQFLGAAQLVFWGQVVCRDTFQQWSVSYMK